MLTEILILVTLTVIGVTVQTVAGFGFLFFLTPGLLLYFDAPTAITTSLLVASVLSLLVLFDEHRVREESIPVATAFIAAAIPGSILGSLVLTAFDNTNSRSWWAWSSFWRHSCNGWYCLRRPGRRA